MKMGNQFVEERAKFGMSPYPLHPPANSRWDFIDKLIQDPNDWPAVRWEVLLSGKLDGSLSVCDISAPLGQYNAYSSVMNIHLISSA